MIFLNKQELFISTKKKKMTNQLLNGIQMSPLLSNTILSTPSQKLRVKERNGTKGQLI